MESLAAGQQLEELETYINDPHGRVATGVPDLDKLLRRGGLAAGTFCLFGGRTRTRKTTVMCNMIISMLQAGVKVGIVGLDEARHSYFIKLMSAAWRESLEQIEREWNFHPGQARQEAWLELAKNLMVYPNYTADVPDDLNRWLLECEVMHQCIPNVVFIDYTSKLKRRQYDGNGANRMELLTERLAEWTKETGVITIGLHQVGRLDEGSGLRYHGDTPMTLEGLKYGGEAEADIVFATYRPALDPFGNMRYDMARRFKGQSFKDEEWQMARESVEKYREYTFVQLLKNRPGTRTDEEGIPVRSFAETMYAEQDTSILVDGYAPVGYDEGSDARAIAGQSST